MAIKQFSNELSRFLAVPDPEVLCITGKWGVGKTFTWNHYLKKARDEKRLALDTYSYVSLFGQNSLDDVRYVLFENKINKEHIGQKPSLATLESTIKTASGGWRKLAGLTKLIPGYGDAITRMAKLGFFSIRTQIVCFDDLERLGANLKPIDILGLISFLKEERNCKVVLLLNDDALTNEDKNTFKLQLEKVTDITLRFEPTPTEAADIGVDDTTAFSHNLKEDCIALGIVNIRLIKRIERYAIRLAEELRGLDPRVLQGAIHSAALFVYAKFQPDIAPSIEFLRSFNTYKSLENKKNEDSKHASMRALLSQYDFAFIDDLGKVILKGVEHGHLDSQALKVEARKQDQLIKLQDTKKSFSDAWELYHNSFDDNADKVLDSLEHGIQTCAPAITPRNLSATIELLKDLGRESSAKRLILHYVHSRNETADFWNLNKDSRDVTDPDVVQAFAEKYVAAAARPDPASILIRIGEQKSWNPEDVTILAQLSSCELYSLFKGHSGTQLGRMIYGALMFSNISNSNSEMHLLTMNAKDALGRIARESPLNAKRVSKYISVDNLYGPWLD